MCIVLTRLVAGSHKPGTDCAYFPSLAHFSVISAGSIQALKNVKAVKIKTQRYFKGIIYWYYENVPYLS